MRRRIAGAERWLPAIAGAVYGFHPIVEGDTFWHLMLGRAVLRHGSRTVPEPTAFSAFSDLCVVSEWLWDVLTFELHQLGGMTALSLLSPAFGALIGYLVGSLIAQLAPRASWVLRGALGSVTMCASADLLNVRPNLAFLALLVGLLILSYRYAEANEPRVRLRFGLAIVVMAQVWAQTHASFVLAGPIFASTLLPQLPKRPREQWSGDGAVLLGILLTLLTGPHGLHVVDLVLSHSHGDAVQHIADMKPFDWTSIGPFGWPLGAALMLSFVLIAQTWLSGAQLDAGALLLAALGAALTWTAGRFAAPFVILLLPLSATALRELSERHPAGTRRALQIEVAAVIVSACMLVWTYRRIDDVYGPTFESGVRVAAHPIGAARYLARMPRGTPVLTEYAVGGPLGFWLDGQVRTFVDGRTPMYFDDTDWAIARDVMVSPEALELALVRYGVRAAVVERDSIMCRQLATRWQAVVVEARFTTFVPAPAAGGAALPGLQPCGPFYFAEDACSDGGRALQQTLAKLAALQATRFVGFLRAAAALQCHDPAAKSAWHRLPSEHDARMYAPAYRLYASWALLVAGRGDAALDQIEAGLDHDDPLAVRVLLEPEAAELPIARMRALLERGLEQMNDSAPAAFRSRLALICSAQGDAECARLQGLRAYVLGARDAVPALVWAAQHHPSPRVRRDLAAWLAARR